MSEKLSKFWEQKVWFCLLKNFLMIYGNTLLQGIHHTLYYLHPHSVLLSVLTHQKRCVLSTLGHCLPTEIASQIRACSPCFLSFSSRQWTPGGGALFGSWCDPLSLPHTMLWFSLVSSSGLRYPWGQRQGPTSELDTWLMLINSVSKCLRYFQDVSVCTAGLALALEHFSEIELICRFLEN